jgi:WD40 repeat protein
VRTGDRLADAKGAGNGFGLGVVDADTGTAVLTGDDEEVLHIRRGTRRTWPTDQSISALALAPGATQLAAGGERGTIELLDTTRRAAFGSPISGPANAVALDPDGEVVAVADEANDLSLWNARTGEVIEPELGTGPDRGYITSLGFSESGEEITAVSQRGKRLSAQIWPRSGAAEPPPTITLSAYRVDPFGIFPEISPDGSVLAWSHGRNIRIWSIRDNRAREVGPISSDGIDAELAFSPDSRTIVAWSDHTVLLVPADGSGKPVRLPDLGSVRQAAVGPDRVAIGLETGALRLWDRGAAETVGGELAGPTSGKLLFSPDGSLLVVVGDTIDAWEMAGRRQIADGLGVLPDEEAVQQVGFGGDPLSLVVLGESRPYIVDPIVWDADPAAFEKRVCAIANRNLRRDETIPLPEGRAPLPCVR